MRLPCNPGNYGSGFSAFSIHEPAAGAPRPYLELRCRVTNGRLETNPELTSLTFHPPLDNFAWIETPRFTIDDNGRIIANLNGFFNQTITRDLLGIDAVPLRLSALYDLIIERSASMAATAAQFSAGGNPFDLSAYELRVNHATLSAGNLPIPAEILSARIAPGTTVNVIANAGHVQMTGDYAFSSISLTRPELALRGGAVSAHGTLDLRLDSTTGVPSSVALALDRVDVSADSLAVTDSHGSRIALGRTVIHDGALSIDVSLPSGTTRSPPSLIVNGVSTTLTSGTLHAVAPGVDSPITLSAGAVTGSLALRNGNLDATLSSAALSASARGLSAGRGMARLAYSEATISGAGSVRFNDGRATFDGALAIEGTVDDAHIGRLGGPFSLDVATGARIALNVSHASFGGAAEPELAATGELDVTLDSGEITLPGGQRITLARGTRAYLNASEIVSNEAGMTVRGALEIEAELGAAMAPETLAPGVRVSRIAGAEGRFHITIANCELLPDGSFRAAGLDASAHATVRSITGRIAPSLITSRARSTSRASTETMAVAPATTALPVIAPSFSDTVRAIDSAHVRVSVPLPAGDVIRIPLPFGASYAPVTIANGTTATFTMSLRSGEIDRPSVRVTLNPPLDLPAWVTSDGIGVEPDGTLVLRLSGAPNVNLSNILGERVPSTLMALIESATRLSGAGGSRSSELEAHPLQTLAAHGVGVHVSDVSFARPIGLGGNAFVTPAAGNRFSVDITGGELRLSGRVAIADGAIGDGGTGITGLRGSANVSVRVTGDGDARVIDTRLSISDAHVATLGFARSNGDRLALTEAHVADSTLSLRSAHGETTVTADLGSVSGALAPSRLSVAHGSSIVPIAIEGGSFEGSDLHVTQGGFNGAGTLTGVRVSAPALDLPISGLALHTTRLDATVTGGVSFDSGARMSFTGDIAVAADIDRGSLGSSSGNFSARVGTGTRARFAFTELALGDFEVGHRLAAGSGDLRLALRGGHITLPNGTRLTLAAGSTGTLRVDSLNQVQGDAVADIRGSFRFSASTAARIPASGLEVAPGVRLRRVAGSSGTFELSGAGFHLGHDGRFSIGSVRLDATVHADAVEASAPR